jgi:Domain of unknown function (DUF4394)/FG-GAP-like repeat
MLRTLRSRRRQRQETVRRSALAIENLEERNPASSILALTSSNTLIRFDSAAPGTIQSSVAITGLQSMNESAIGIDFRPRTGQLFLTTVPTGVAANALVRTYSLNALTGAATFVGSIPNTVPGAADVPSGYDFNPTVDRIRVVNANDENFRINPNNGSLAGDDPNLNPAGNQIIAEAYDRNFDRAVATTIPTTLYGISRASSSLVTQGGINGAGPGGANGGLIASVGPLGVVLNATADAGFDITTGPGTGRGFAALTVGSQTGLYSINLSTGAATLVGNIGNGATQVKGLTVVPDSTLAIGTDAGGGAATVAALDGFTGAVRFAATPFGGFRGGVHVAAGDVTGDGVPDIIAAPGRGGLPVAVVLDGNTGTVVRGLLAFPPGFADGVNVAAGDVNGDGFDDIIVAPESRGFTLVRVFSGKDSSLLSQFVAYTPAFGGGVHVAAADFNLDGRAEIVTTPGAGAPPIVRVFDNTGTPMQTFVAGSLAFRSGLSVAAGDVTGDGRAEIIVGLGAGDPPFVGVFSGGLTTGFNLAGAFPAYPTQFNGGVRVALADFNRDGRFEIRTSPGSGFAALVNTFDGVTLQSLNTAFLGTFSRGLFIGGARAS